MTRGLPEQRVTWHLDNWAEFKRDRASDFGHGYNYKDGSGACSNSSREFDSMVVEADKRCAEIVDTKISDLPPVQEIAVKHFHLGDDVPHVYRLGSLRDRPTDINDAYRRARAYLAIALARFVE